MNTENLSVGLVVKNYREINPRTLRAREERIGMKNHNNQGILMEIIDYNGFNDVTVKFDDGSIVYKRIFSKFVAGKINNPFLSEDD